MKKALLRRAITGVKHAVKINADKEATLAQFQTAEKDLEMEFFELAAEAETFRLGWGQEIIGDAAKLYRLEEQLAKEKKSKDDQARAQQHQQEMAAKTATAKRSSPPSSQASSASTSPVVKEKDGLLSKSDD